MSDDLLDFARQSRCVFYNDLSHMNPLYAAPDLKVGVYREDEILYHKRNIYLLSLQFEHVIICTDNILGFTKHLQADVIGSVVGSDWFRKLLEAGVIVLCGWGANRNIDMIQNQIEYSQHYKPALKAKSYIELVKNIASGSRILVREYADGEKDHIQYLLPRIEPLSDLYSSRDFGSILEKILITQQRVGYVGTMEIFPEIDQRLAGKSAADHAFYRAYFHSWQEYSSAQYYPITTVDTARSGLPGRALEFRENERQVKLLSALYSPDFFLKYLEARFGASLTHKIFGLRAEVLIRVRNGDWKVFLEEYHKCILAASEMAWIYETSMSSEFLSDENSINAIIDSVLGSLLQKEVDVESFAAVVGGVIAFVTSAGPLVPLVKLLKKRIDRILRHAKSTLYSRHIPTENFLQKLQTALDGKFFIPSAQ